VCAAYLATPQRIIEQPAWALALKKTPVFKTKPNSITSEQESRSMSSTDQYEAQFERSKFLRAEIVKLITNNEPKKAYTLYLADPLGARASYDTFVQSHGETNETNP